MDKNWYKSKTVWTAVVGAILAVVHAMGYPIPTQVFGVLGAFGLYSVRDALK